jgi:acetoin utilization deacetylase AcuC-like enzyme
MFRGVRIGHVIRSVPPIAVVNRRCRPTAQPIRCLSISVLYLHHPSSQLHVPSVFAPEHPDDARRLQAIEAAVAQSGLRMRRCLAPAATSAELELVHTREHVTFIADLCGAGGGSIDEDTYVGEASFVAAAHAVGAACRMVRELADGRERAAFCAVRPPGHHADRDRAMGFCLFNNVAIAAELAVRELGFERVMIIDWDVHHGNGTAEIFRRRADVLYVSIHQQGLFPGTGALTDAGSGPGSGYTINLPVPRGTGEEVWVSLVEHLIAPIGIEFRPQLILISAGFDAHERDPVGQCVLQTESFAEIARHIRELGLAVNAPIGAVLEGGYDPDALAASVVATLRALAGDGDAVSIAPDPIVTPRIASHLAHRWAL